MKFEFEDGNWWELRDYLPVALERKFIRHAVDAQETLDNPDLELIKSLAERMDQLVVESTTSWSYGPVDIDTFYNVVPGPHYSQVAERIGEVYGPLVSSSIERGLKLYTSLLGQADASQ